MSEEPMRHSLGQTPLSWDQVRDIIESNTLERLYRSSEMMEKYHTRKDYLKNTNQSVFKFLLTQQLHWISDEQSKLPDNEVVIHPNSNKLFSDPGDLLIIENEFPYFFEEDVVHLVVWTKLPILPDPNHEMGDITPETRKLIDLYVTKTFVDYLDVPKERVLWFRNWSALQSVKGISHIHVLIKGLPHEKLKSILNTPGKFLVDEDLKHLKL